MITGEKIYLATKMGRAFHTQTMATWYKHDHLVEAASRQQSKYIATGPVSVQVDRSGLTIRVVGVEASQCERRHNVFFLMSAYEL